MVDEYMDELYEPAHSAYAAMRSSNFQLARDKANWNNMVTETWHNVKFVEMGPGPDASVLSGSAILMRAAIDLAALTPSDVRVEALVGRVGPTGQLENTEILRLPATGQQGAAWVFQKEFIPRQTGLLGYALRVGPNYGDNPLTRPCNSLLKWGLE
jgi:starch phosphorylase